MDERLIGNNCSASPVTFTRGPFSVINKATQVQKKPSYRASISDTEVDLPFIGVLFIFLAKLFAAESADTEKSSEARYLHVTKYALLVSYHRFARTAYIRRRIQIFGRAIVSSRIMSRRVLIGGTRARPVRLGRIFVRTIVIIIRRSRI